MSADLLSSREDDFSHLYHRVIHANLPQAEPIVRSSFQYLLIGCVVSIVLHALVLAFYWKQDSQPLGQSVSPPLIIQLTLKTQKIIPVEMPSVPSEVAEPERLASEIKESVQVNSATRVESQIPDKPETKPIVVQPLTMEELRELNQQKNASTDEPVTGIAANVFNPALRKRLHEEASKPELQRADAGPTTHTDPSGATIVDLGGGKCLRSSVPKPGEAQNWYMTSCGGKSESEQIMERINQAVNGKLIFER